MQKADYAYAPCCMTWDLGSCEMAKDLLAILLGVKNLGLQFDSWLESCKTFRHSVKLPSQSPLRTDCSHQENQRAGPTESSASWDFASASPVNRHKRHDGKRFQPFWWLTNPGKRCILETPNDDAWWWSRMQVLQVHLKAV